MRSLTCHLSLLRRIIEDIEAVALHHFQFCNGEVYISFQDYRFGLKARLNLLPTKSVSKRIGKVEIYLCMLCRQAPETLAHILNACPPNAPLMRERHNKILERTVKAIPPSAGDRFVEQTVSGSPFDLRPDIVCINASERTAAIVDIPVPFEWSPEALQAARDEKERKYGPLAQWLKEERNLTSVSLEALVVGGSGCLGPQELCGTQRTLHISRRFAVLYKKLCSTDAISGSQAIWSARNQATH